MRPTLLKKFPYVRYATPITTKCASVDETDWKVIVIDKEDRWAPELNDVEDVERLLPGVVSAIREWFRT